MGSHISGPWSSKCYSTGWGVPALPPCVLTHLALCGCWICLDPGLAPFCSLGAQDLAASPVLTITASPCPSPGKPRSAASPPGFWQDAQNTLSSRNWGWEGAKASLHLGGLGGPSRTNLGGHPRPESPRVGAVPVSANRALGGCVGSSLPGPAPQLVAPLPGLVPSSWAAGGHLSGRVSGQGTLSLQ